MRESSFWSGWKGYLLKQTEGFFFWVCVCACLPFFFTYPCFDLFTPYGYSGKTLRWNATKWRQLKHKVGISMRVLVALLPGSILICSIDFMPDIFFWQLAPVRAVGVWEEFQRILVDSEVARLTVMATVEKKATQMFNLLGLAERHLKFIARSGHVCVVSWYSNFDLIFRKV